MFGWVAGSVVKYGIVFSGFSLFLPRLLFPVPFPMLWIYSRDREYNDLLLSPCPVNILVRAVYPS